MGDRPLLLLHQFIYAQVGWVSRVLLLSRTEGTSACNVLLSLVTEGRSRMLMRLIPYYVCISIDFSLLHSIACIDRSFLRLNHCSARI